MPRRAPSICTYPGCNVLVRGGSRCDLHPYAKPGKAERQYTREKERARSLERRSDPTNRINFYNTGRWRKLRNWYIRANPLCDECKEHGRMVAGEVVDHIIPISAGGGALDSENLQTLCKPCHTAKGNRDRGRGD